MSQYAGDMSSRVMSGEKINFQEEIKKFNPSQPFVQLPGGDRNIWEKENKRLQDARASLLKEQQELRNHQMPSSTSKSKLKKYVFNQDYEATQRVEQEKAVGDYTEAIRSIPIKYKFKKGDIFEGEQIPVNAGVNPNARKYDIAITTTESIKYDGSIRKGLVTFQIDDSIVDEATFLQANRKQLLIALALVAGYFAYKKLKK